MSSTCPYILAKTTQLVVAARITTKNDNVKELVATNRLAQKLAKFKAKLQLIKPDVVDNLPPRFNIKGLTTVARYLSFQVRTKGLLSFRTTEQSIQQVNISLPDSSEIHGSEDSSSAINKAYFSKFGIKEDELDRCVKEIKTVKNQWLLEQNEHKQKDDWSMLLRQKDLVVWRRLLNDNGLYEYKAFGTFHDISADAFFQSQLDLNYRKSWDKYAIALNVVDKSSNCGSEVVHWTTRFPYPLKSRDYVFVRRSKIDLVTNTMVLVSKAVTHAECPETSEYIRVKDYESQMVIRPRRTFNQNGFDYIITYHDDSRVNVPSFCVNMITGSAVPDFLKTVHDAAMRLGKTEKTLPE